MQLVLLVLRERAYKYNLRCFEIRVEDADVLRISITTNEQLNPLQTERSYPSSQFYSSRLIFNLVL